MSLHRSFRPVSGQKPPHHSTIQLTADTYTHLMAKSKGELAEKMDVIT